MPSKMTFHDVARLAGVSTQTVSRVTNNNPNVSAATRQKVLAAIEQLGYVPNKSAQLLGRKKSWLIGLITLDFSLYGAVMIAAGVRQAAQHENYGLATVVVNAAKLNDVITAIRELGAQQVDAIIINAPLSFEQATTLIHTHSRIPLIFTDTTPGPELSVITSDHYQGGQQAARLLLQQGRQRIACINGPKHSPTAKLRRLGWLEEIAQHHIAPQLEKTGDWHAADGYRLTKEILAETTDLDGILCANDQMALGALRALHESDIDIPAKIAVIGFDDTPDSAMFFPPLTTIQQDFVALGQQLVQTVLERINGGPATRSLQVSTSLTRRASA